MLIEIAAVFTLGISVAIGVVHFYDRFHEKGLYRQALTRGEGAIAGIKRLEPHLAMLNERVGEALTPDPGAVAEAQRQFALFAETITKSVQEGVAPVAESVKTSMDALVAGLATIGAQTNQTKSVSARQLKGMEAVGAKQILAQIGQQLGGNMGGIVASVAGQVIDDDTAVQLAELFIANPQLLAMVQTKAKERGWTGGENPSSGAYMVR